MSQEELNELKLRVVRLEYVLYTILKNQFNHQDPVLFEDIMDCEINNVLDVATALEQGIKPNIPEDIMGDVLFFEEFGDELFRKKNTLKFPNNFLFPDELEKT